MNKKARRKNLAIYVVVLTRGALVEVVGKALWWSEKLAGVKYAKLKTRIYVSRYLVEVDRLQLVVIPVGQHSRVAPIGRQNRGTWSGTE